MEQQGFKLDLSKINFEENRSYAFLKVKDKTKREKKYKMLLSKAKRRGATI